MSSISEYYKWLAFIDYESPRFRLDRGQLDLSPPEDLMASAAEHLRCGPFTYAGVLPAFSEAARIDFHNVRQKHVSESDVIPTIGAMGALNIVLQALSTPGDLILIPAPFWPVIPEVIRRYNCRIETYPFSNQSDKTNLPVYLSEYLRANNPNFIIMNTPHNPTGLWMDAKDVRLLKKELDEHSVICIWDEAYESLTPLGAASRALSGDLIDLEKDIIITTASKRYGVPALRIGSIFTGPRFSERLKEVSFLQTGGVSRIFQDAVANLLLNGTSWESALTKTIQERRDAINYHDFSVEITDNQAGLFFTINIPPHVNDYDLSRHLLTKGVAVMPGYLFGMVNSLRISLGVEARKILEAVDIIGAEVKSV